MRAHLVQLDIAWEDPTENFHRVDSLLEPISLGGGIKSGDLIVLPEMFATGFSLHNHITTPAAAAILDYLTRLAQDTKAFVVGGRAVGLPDDSLAENRAPVINPAGELICEYAKIHPFGFGRENEVIRPGATPVSWDWTTADQSLRVGMGICYDLRFPELFRKLALPPHNAQCFIVSANWPKARHAHWRALAIARAIENQAFMLAVNRCGCDPHLQYAGGTIAIDPKGELMGELDDKPGVLSIDLDPAIVTDWRKTFPALRDIRLL